MDNRIKLIAIDEESISKVDTPFFLWGPKINTVVGKLIESGSNTIGLDVFFDTSMDSYDPKATRTMQANLLSGKVVLIGVIGFDQLVHLPSKQFTAVAGMENIGLSNIAPDTDGIIRKQAVFFEAKDGKKLLTLPFLLAEKAQSVKIKQEPDLSFYFGKNRIIEENGLVTVNYAGGPKTFPTYSFGSVYDKAVKNDKKYFFENFNESIVIIGRTDISGKDVFDTPYNVKKDSLMSGIELHANTINMITTGQYISRMPSASENLIICIICVAGIFLFYHLRGRIALVLVVVSMLTIIFSVYWFYSFHNYVFKSVLFGLALFFSYGFASAYKYFTISIKLRRIRDAFGKLISPKVEEDIWKDNIEVSAGKCEMKKLTVLFLDINNFSNKCEELEAEEIFVMLNSFYEEMVEIIVNNNGIVSKFIGDEIMALFGYASFQHTQASCAIKTVGEMIDCMEKMKIKTSNQGFCEAKIGIHTGEMITGFLGSSKRLEHTVIGENVNLGARLEQLNKKFGTTVLISKASYDEMLNENSQTPIPNFDFINMGEQEIKGFTKKIQVYQVLLKEGIKHEKCS
jgi:class 3 adenylate cyclase/CHASE2 domain-containing sensor protein